MGTLSSYVASSVGNLRVKFGTNVITKILFEYHYDPSSIFAPRGATGGNHAITPRLPPYFSSGYFRQKETKPAGKKQYKNFTLSSLLLYIEEKERVRWSPVIVKLES